ncbi:MAG: hypothetical protein R3B95_19970 [Nitrospirales bacterium]|nr:hypothetical protein [Nitrospirales bacterium]
MGEHYRTTASSITVSDPSTISSGTSSEDGLISGVHYNSPSISNRVYPTPSRRWWPRITINRPDQSWGTNITYILTAEGLLYLAVVMDFALRRIIGCSMQPTLGKKIALDALLMAVWRRQSKQDVIIHSNKGRSRAVLIGSSLVKRLGCSPA